MVKILFVPQNESSFNLYIEGNFISNISKSKEQLKADGKNIAKQELNNKYIKTREYYAELRNLLLNDDINENEKRELKVVLDNIVIIGKKYGQLVKMLQ